MANRNTLYAEIFVDELARSGLTTVCAAPGSRHTPLMLAFAKHPDIKVYSHLDERSASFFALGLALASDSPVALICTSGTAGANMYPAIIEAHQSRVPLIVITADRPAELRHSGANQTIDQIKMFGDFVLWFVDTALPEANPPAVAIRNLRTTANRAYATANGLRKGVVHINMPFRKPLEPTPVEGDMIEVPQLTGNRMRTSIITRSKLSAGDEGKRFRIEAYDLANRGIIVCGRNCPSDSLPLFGLLSQYTGFPLFADSLSGVRYLKNPVQMALGGFETYIRHTQAPELVIRFGDIPLSKNLNALLDSDEIKYRLVVSEDGVWNDDTHYPTEIITADVQGFCNDLIKAIHMPVAQYDTSLIDEFDELEKTTWQVINDEMQTGAYFDGGVVYDVVDLIPDESTLFAGNSLPVRLLDQFGKPQNKRIYTYANRGASGIDGNISSALGAGAARPDKPLVAVVGDITFYHDMNGLLAVHRCGVPITLVLINNDGGGIFHRLPIKDFEPEFTEYFLTPHGLDFSHAAKMYGLEHTLIDVTANSARAQFRQAFSESVNGRKSSIIEVRTDALRDLARRDEIVNEVQKKLKENHKDTEDTKK